MFFIKESFNLQGKKAGGGECYYVTKHLWSGSNRVKLKIKKNNRYKL